jgi:hypothetical protein
MATKWATAARAANASFDWRLAIAMWQRLLGAEYFPDYA